MTVVVLVGVVLMLRSRPTVVCDFSIEDDASVAELLPSTKAVGSVGSAGALRS